MHTVWKVCGNWQVDHHLNLEMKWISGVAGLLLPNLKHSDFTLKFDLISECRHYTNINKLKEHKYKLILIYNLKI